MSTFTRLYDLAAEIDANGDHIRAAAYRTVAREGIADAPARAARRAADAARRAADLAAARAADAARPATGNVLAELLAGLAA